MLVPENRTVAQPVVAICRNTNCKLTDFYVSDRSKHVTCPGCGNNKAIAIQQLIHVLVPDRAGKIQGGSGGMYSVECDPDLTVMGDLETLTGSIEAANCPQCLKEYKERIEAEAELTSDDSPPAAE